MKTSVAYAGGRTARRNLGESVADTRQLLLEASIMEFRHSGFDGTDTNKIARRAGFAPQTFYRWFEDKTDIFLAAYRAWEEEEHRVLESLIAERAASERFVASIVSHHRNHLLFRRSLRKLALEEPKVRQARAQSRARQIEQILAWGGRPSSDKPIVAALLLQLERLVDALAEGELRDLGISQRDVEGALGELIHRLRSN